MTDDPRVILEVNGLAKAFAGVHAVQDASFTVAEGSMTALIGPNGAGKTTTFNLIAGAIEPDHGTVVFEGQHVEGLEAYEVARTGMMRTFQLPHTMAAMTVWDNMLIGSTDHPGESLSGALFRRRRHRQHEVELRDRAAELLTLVGLADKRHDYGGTLSGGQRKLLELGRLLMAQPNLVLLDEPLAGVNPALRERLMDLIHQIRAERGTTFLFIEHDMTAVMNRSDWVIVMSQGTVIATGTPQEVRRNPLVIEAYLGGAA